MYIFENNVNVFRLKHANNVKNCTLLNIRVKIMLNMGSKPDTLDDILKHRKTFHIPKLLHCS